jgi:hypothetical protein
MQELAKSGRVVIFATKYGKNCAVDLTFDNPFVLRLRKHLPDDIVNMYMIQKYAHVRNNDDDDVTEDSDENSNECMDDADDNSDASDDDNAHVRVPVQIQKGADAPTDPNLVKYNEMTECQRDLIENIFRNIPKQTITGCLSELYEMHKGDEKMPERNASKDVWQRYYMQKRIEYFHTLGTKNLYTTPYINKKFVDMGAKDKFIGRFIVWYAIIMQLPNERAKYERFMDITRDIADAAIVDVD